MIALLNFNRYLGGGETIFTRWANHLQKEKEEFKLFYPSKSFIADELHRIGINEEYLCPYDGDTNYYYLSDKNRQEFVDWIYSKLTNDHDVKLVSFCFKDLYTILDVTKRDKDFTITHLILHDEDNMYVCQTLKDKLIQKILGRRQFSDKHQLAFNNQLLRDLVTSGGLIAEKMTTKIVMAKHNVNIDEDIIVPPPMCDFPEEMPKIKNNKKIIWLGRIVDFKLPAICSMLDFVCKKKEYQLTIIGDGEIDFLKKYMANRGLTYDNINFLGVIPYNQIASVIKQHSIGYACGTSIVEIGQHGLPIITALASSTHKLFKRPICGGVYNNKYKGNEGNNLFIGESEEEQPLIEDTIRDIESDFDGCALRSYKAMKADFDFTTNVKKYMEIINAAKPLQRRLDKVPRSGFLRRIAYSIFAE